MPLLRWRKQEFRERFYPEDFLGMYDRLAAEIHARVRPGDTILDAGCGSGRVFQYHFDAAHRPKLILGVDRTHEPRANRNIDAAARADLAALPLRAAAFDLAISSHVAEHLTQPERVFAELARVLRPGGLLLLLTPNRWHYVTVGATLLPHAAHLRFNRWRGVDQHDIFPTVYRANTARRLRALLEASGFDVERIDQFETEPEYLAFSLPTYALGVAYERLVNRFGALRNLRVNLLAVARKR
ncbi:MAG: methyltransferase domain-containing protein [Dehalococcoidia bacterium]